MCFVVTFGIILSTPKTVIAESTTLQATAVFRKAFALPDLNKSFYDPQEFNLATQELKETQGINTVCKERVCILIIE